MCPYSNLTEKQILKEKYHSTVTVLVLWPHLCHSFLLNNKTQGNKYDTIKVKMQK